MSRQLTIWVAGIMLLLGQSSCFVLKRHRGGSKKTDIPVVIQPVVEDTTAATAPPEVTDSLEVARQTLMQTLRPLWDRKINFNTFSGKAKVYFEGRGQKQEVVAHIRMKKDSVIWASVTAVGGLVQVARVMITPDSIKMINYLDKDVRLMAIADAQKILPVRADFNTLQNLIIGNILRPEGEPADAQETPDTYVLRMQEPTLVQQGTFNKVDSTLTLLQMQAAQSNGPAGAIKYSSYQTIGDQKFPGKRELQVVNDEEQFYLEMDFNNAELEKGVEFPFSIPKNYERK